MNQQKSPQLLSKLLAYILERKPDEFGLVLSEDGFVKIKELLKAINEEPDYRWVRRSNIDDIPYILPNPPVEIRDTLIRAKNRDQLPKRFPAEHLPKLLFTCIRNRAYPHTINEGISPGATPYVVLSSNPEMAKRIGKRIDPFPVLLTVQVSESVARGVIFLHAGDTLFLSDRVPADCFSGPPLPKEKPEPAPKPIKKKIRDIEPGSFFMDPESKISGKDRSKRKKDREISRKRDRDRKRKNREREW